MLLFLWRNKSVAVVGDRQFKAVCTYIPPFQMMRRKFIWKGHHRNVVASGFFVCQHHINPQSGLANRPMSGPYSRNRCRYMTPGGVAFRSDHKNEQANRHSAIGPREGRSTIEYGIK